MLTTRFYPLLLILTLQGCVSVGETAIRTNRTLYNEAIHDTSNQQLLLNIVRAKFSELPTFLVATEIDATNSASAGISGGAGMIGLLTGSLGAVTGTASVSDVPVSKYLTLNGSELIQQTSLPISPESISRLESSDYGVLPTLAFTVARWTPAFLDYYWASFTLSTLDDFGAVSLQNHTENDFTVIFHSDGNVGTRTKQEDDPQDSRLACLGAAGFSDAGARKLWTHFRAAVGEKKNQNSVTFGLPMAKLPHLPIYTLSAYGTLKQAEQSAPIVFLHRQDYLRLVAANKSKCSNPHYYYLPKETKGEFVYSIEESDSELFSLVQENITEESQFVLKTDSASNDSRQAFRNLGHLLAFILVVVSETENENAFVSVHKGGLWYSVERDDLVSKKNLILLNQILTIQAKPNASQPTPSSLIVGRPG